MTTPTTTGTTDDRLDLLVALRAGLGKKPPSDRELAQALRGYAPTTDDDAAWAAAVRAARARVTAATPDVALAARRAAEALGIDPPVKWASVSDGITPALALGIAPRDAAARKRLGAEDGLAAAIVGRAHGLWSEGAPPSASAIAAAVVWRQLGLAGKPKPTPPEVRAHFLGQLIDQARLEPKRALRQVAVRAIGAVRSDSRALREALNRRWLRGATWEAPRSNHTPAAPAAPAAGDADALLAEVRRVLDDPATPRWGDRKVFITVAWRALPPATRPTLEAFKQRLVAAHRAGALELARADLTAAMPADELAASATHHLEATYHFIVREAS